MIKNAIARIIIRPKTFAKFKLTGAAFLQSSSCNGDIAPNHNFEKLKFAAQFLGPELQVEVLCFLQSSAASPAVAWSNIHRTLIIFQNAFKLHCCTLLHPFHKAINMTDLWDTAASNCLVMRLGSRPVPTPIHFQPVECQDLDDVSSCGKSPRLAKENRKKSDRDS